MVNKAHNVTVRDAKKVVYDIESLPNFFCVVFSELDGDRVFSYEISKYKNDHRRILTQLHHYEMIGYNNHGYDDVLMNYIVDNPNCTAEDINKLSQAIIALGRDRRDETLKKFVRKYKHGRYFKSRDIMTMLASSKLRVSLKQLQVMINWHNVEEFECDWEAPLPEELWTPCIRYCVNDVLSLKAVCHYLKKDFTLRDYVHAQTGFDVFSKDPVKIAEFTMADSIAKGYNEYNTQRFIWDTVSNNKPINRVDVGSLILPCIKFKTPLFNKVLDKYKAFKFSPREEALKPKKDKFKMPVLFNGMYLNFGLGGLHHDYKKGKVFKKPCDGKLIQADVSSYYPSIRIEHLSHRFDPYFLEEYKKAYREKAEGKASGDKMLEGYAKLKLNSTFGLYNSVYSPLYAPLVAYGTTINGQLMLAMLIEELDLNGFQVIGTNTDAVNVFVPDARWDEYINICSEWESKTRMKLDQDMFEVIYEQSCNNYIAVMEGGYAKTKGTFVPELSLLKGYKYPIVKKALIEHLTKGVSVEKFIREHNNIYDFCMSTKMGVSTKTGMRFEAVHNGVVLQRTNRYYASTGQDAGYLYKVSGAKQEHVLKNSAVVIFNEYEERSMKDYAINYSFYITEALDVVEKLHPSQFELLL